MSTDPSPARLPRCARCGDVVGVYERAVAVVGGEPVATSWLKVEDPAAVEAIFHRGCHAGAAA